MCLPTSNMTGDGPPPASRQPPANLTMSTTTTAPTAPTAVREADSARETGTVKCWGWPEASEYYISQGVDYLSDLPGKPSNGPGPGECGRVSCSWSAAIWWCNDVSLTPPPSTTHLLVVHPC